MKIKCPICKLESEVADCVINKEIPNKYLCPCGNEYQFDVSANIIENIPAIRKMEIKDSGKRQEFNSGSVRDTDEGKGQPHLIPGEALFHYKTNHNTKDNFPSTLDLIENNLLMFSKVSNKREDTIDYLYTAIDYTIEYIKETTDGCYSSPMRAVAIHFQQGAKKYAKNNWRKGQPISRMYDSAMRHLWACIDKKEDEPHSSALLWNLFAIVQTKLDVLHGYLPIELDDFPFLIEEIWEKK